ncbi:MAG: asparagine synthase (glutamine-hydrolyzing) [Vicinamibacterales bacterium]
MCAIAGLVCLKSGCREEDHAALVARMCEVQAHRGPDDRGVMPLGRVCLGADRLSIIDLSPAGHMPMADASGRYCIAYNGETYNFRALREELAALGQVFRSKTDTEVVMAALARWGTPALDRLVGMYGFALVDREAGTLTLVRDRLGKKPVYYAIEDGHFLFASEVKALVAVCRTLRPNRHRLIEWSLFRNTDFGSPETLVEGVSSLPAGHLLVVRDGVVGAPEAYYTPASDVDPERFARLAAAPPSAVVGTIDTMLTDSVRARLVSDVPLGTLCSGGLDSSLITALCARELPDVTAFHVSVTGYPSLDEQPYAAKVAAALGIRLLSYPMSADDFRAHLPRAIYHSDFPLTHPNSVAFMLVSEFARRHGVGILLSGEGADELFGGYMQRYRRYRQFLRARQLLARLPLKLRKIVALAGYAADGVPATTFWEYEGLLGHATAFLDGFSRDALQRRAEDAYAFVPSAGDRAVLGAMLADLTNFLAPLLRRLDRMSMAASVECRTPFLDRAVVREAVNLPLGLRLHGRTDKWLLKQVAERYVPRDVVHRQKVGFPLPVADYLAPLARPELFDDGFCVGVLGLDPRGVRDAVTGWSRQVHGFFNLLALEIWGRQFFMGQSVDDVTAHVLPAGTVPLRMPAAVSG